MAYRVKLNQKLDFYFVDNDYIKYLQNEEVNLYGNTKTPIMKYPEHCHPKFMCGPIFQGVSGFDYYTPVSSYSQQKNANILITNPMDRKDPVKGSLRLNYMIPVPKEVLSRYSIKDIKNWDHKLLLMKEYEFIQDFASNIKSFAKALYEDIYEQKCSTKLLMNSSRMKFIEDRCYAYARDNSLMVPPRPVPKYMPENDKVLWMIEREAAMMREEVII